MSDDEERLNFHEMELDDRILKAIAAQGWHEPTFIQEKAIPFIMDGKDVLLRARTGSGKTGAFVIPLVQKILNAKQTAVQQQIKAMILAPSKELCNQIHKVVLDLTYKCSRAVRCVDISASIDVAAQKPMLAEKPDVIIATPTRALAHLQSQSFALDALELLVIDEADLVFSFGYENELKEVLNYLPKIYQAILASATLSDDVTTLKKLVLRNAVTLKLKEADLPPTDQLSHYHLGAEERDKAAILCSLLKLRLTCGKTIIFVNTVDRCYKIKLFLEQFGVRSCVLNSELPAAIRCHAVMQFNRGVYDVIIASDELSLESPGEIARKKSHQQKSRRRKDRESGVSRGIDFQFVSNVINFDFPLDVNSYVHRAGRTARGNNQGTVLSFMSMRERPLMEKVREYLKDGFGDDVLKAYQFKLEEIEGFRYRAQDAWKAVTRIAVREARLMEIKRELLSSQKLEGYFENNPRDLQILRHDKALHTVRVQPHLADVPDYIVPNTLKNLSTLSKKKFKRKPDKQGPRDRKNAMKWNNPLLNLTLDKKKKKKIDKKKK